MSMPFINPDDFANDQEMLDHIIDHVVLPSLEQQVGADALEYVQGIAYVFGGRSDVNPRVLQRLQRMIEHNGISLEYALREFTTLHVGRKRSTSRAGLQVEYIELIPAQDDGPPLSVAALEEMFER